jgi:hypothetical protein
VYRRPVGKNTICLSDKINVYIYLEIKLLNIEHCFIYNATPFSGWLGPFNPLEFHSA